MKIYIDQSGKVEETNRDTILAFSNHETYAIKIHRRTKRRMLEQFRLYGKPKLFTLRTFSAGVFLLLKSRKTNIDEIVIDTEYFGRNATIKSMLEAMFTKAKSSNNPNITFGHVGKKAKAHLLALSVFRGKQRANRVISYSELKKWAL
ncbi:hypothetical protein HY065_02745 [Candidatus Berkelbacteria bacterium]|nr:hypothetical protein [Candidatus Berkelbacteria bacterium]